MRMAGDMRIFKQLRPKRARRRWRCSKSPKLFGNPHVAPRETPQSSNNFAENVHGLGAAARNRRSCLRIGGRLASPGAGTAAKRERPRHRSMGKHAGTQVSLLTISNNDVTMTLTTIEYTSVFVADARPVLQLRKGHASLFVAEQGNRVRIPDTGKAIGLFVAVKAKRRPA